MVVKIHSKATSGLNGASMMMKRDEGLEMVKKKEERRRKSKTRGKECQHVVGNSHAAARNVVGQTVSPLLGLEYGMEPRYILHITLSQTIADNCRHSSFPPEWSS